MQVNLILLCLQYWNKYVKYFNKKIEKKLYIQN